MKTKFQFFYIVVVLMLLVTPVSHAELIRYEFGGTFSEVYDWENMLNGTLQVGQEFSGYFTYENSLVDPNGGGRYILPNTFEYEVQVGGYTFTHTDIPDEPDKIFVENRNGDKFHVELYHVSSNLPVNLQVWWSIVDLYDYSGTIFTSNDSTYIPEYIPDLSNFDRTNFEIMGAGWVNGDEYYLEWQIDGPLSYLRLAPDPVPEPTTMLLLGTGLVGLAGFRRKCRKR